MIAIFTLQMCVNNVNEKLKKRLQDFKLLERNYQLIKKESGNHISGGILHRPHWWYRKHRCEIRIFLATH